MLHKAVPSLVEGAAVGDDASPNVCCCQMRFVENPHSQLKLTGNFGPQGKHLNAISHFKYILNITSAIVMGLLKQNNYSVWCLILFILTL